MALCSILLSLLLASLVACASYPVRDFSDEESSPARHGEGTSNTPDHTGPSIAVFTKDGIKSAGGIRNLLDSQPSGFGMKELREAAQEQLDEEQAKRQRDEDARHEAAHRHARPVAGEPEDAWVHRLSTKHLGTVRDLHPALAQLHDAARDRPFAAPTPEHLRFARKVVAAHDARTRETADTRRRQYDEEYRADLAQFGLSRAEKMALKNKHKENMRWADQLSETLARDHHAGLRRMERKVSRGSPRGAFSPGPRCSSHGVFC